MGGRNKPALWTVGAWVSLRGPEWAGLQVCVIFRWDCRLSTSSKLARMVSSGGNRARESFSRVYMVQKTAPFSEHTSEVIFTNAETQRQRDQWISVDRRRMAIKLHHVRYSKVIKGVRHVGVFFRQIHQLSHWLWSKDEITLANGRCNFIWIGFASNSLTIPHLIVITRTIPDKTSILHKSHRTDLWLTIIRVRMELRIPMIYWGIFESRIICVSLSQVGRNSHTQVNG